jgi:hypothetical protein
MAVKTISITEEDIARGQGAANRGRVYDCIVARAVKRAIPEAHHVGPRSIWILNEDDNIIVDMPLFVKDFVERADRQWHATHGTLKLDPDSFDAKPLLPFSFTVQYVTKSESAHADAD